MLGEVLVVPKALGGEAVTPSRLAVVGLAAVVGIGLAVHGYSHGLSLGRPGGLLGAPAPTPTTSKPTTAASHPRSSGRASTGPQPTAAQQKLGPLLSSTPYAQFAYQVYPGPRSAQAQLALAGFNVVVKRSGGHIVLSVSASGSSGPPQVSTYPAGDRVYFIEASFGDDSGNAEYNFGDDALLVTNSQGRIVQ